MPLPDNKFRPPAILESDSNWLPRYRGCGNSVEISLIWMRIQFQHSKSRNCSRIQASVCDNWCALWYSSNYFKLSYQDAKPQQCAVQRRYEKTGKLRNKDDLENFSLMTGGPAASLWRRLLKWILASLMESMTTSHRLQCFLSLSHTWTNIHSISCL